ncbi:MAG: glycosyltransferase [Marinospirillum sp.]|uniref:glycosyltransferase n=1 Tax=Marinospirillum sp. TaxID=2183934 RepID=UPI001A0ADC3B|nr:glycosyltransferase [Marinospirillum sp.]MBE0508158.1 glycosyltransferase [Marinospirillum sp.]
MHKIVIVTISYVFDDALVRTLESIDEQSYREFSNVVVVSKCAEPETKDYHAAYRKFVLNEDSSIYNAMNIGLQSAEGDYVLFLNAGDTFHDDNSLSLALDELNDTKCYAFRTNQIWNDAVYVRPPDGKLDQLKKSPAHQGFFVPLCTKTPFFDEKHLIDADSRWMQQCIALFDMQVCDKFLSNFYLGGVSNYPTLNTVVLRYRSQGLIRALKEIVKFLIRKLMGDRLYYRMTLLYLK